MLRSTIHEYPFRVEMISDMLRLKERMPRHNDKAPKRQEVLLLFPEKITLNNDTCTNKDSMLFK